jgi:hypothetical protein
MSENLRDLLAQEAVEAEARADAEERGEVAPQRGQRGRRRSVDPSQVYAVRIPVSRLNELRQLADALGEAPTALIRQWVIEKLDAQSESVVEERTENQAEQQPEVAPLAPGEVRLGSRRRRLRVAESLGVAMPRRVELEKKHA